MDASELVKLAKALPSTEVMVYKREDIEDIYLGKDYVAIYPKGQKASVPTPTVDVAKLAADLMSQMDAKFAALKTELAAAKVENEKLKQPAEPKSAAEPKTETKLSKKEFSEHDILKTLIEKVKYKED